MQAFSLTDHLLSATLGLFLFSSIYLTNRSLRLARARAYALAVAAGDPDPVLPRPLPWKRGLWSAVGLAAFYLLIFRLFTLIPNFWNDGHGAGILMSFSFLFLGPFIAGAITVAQATKNEPWPVTAWILAPWIPVFANIILALSVAWEGAICVIFIAPPAMLSASLGGCAAGALQRQWHRKSARNTLYSLAAVPLLLAMVELKLQQPLETRTVETSILIHAPAEVIWRNIERVPAIAPTELRHSWANTIGFPRPVEATLSHEGAGGVRQASFERGLTFTETITDWVPNQRISFTIRANTETIPRTTLDEHVTVGGRFFDVLTGTYELAPQPDGSTLLHLSSRERLSTDFNLYAAMWSDAVMRDIQSNILHVVRNRCEQQTNRMDVQQSQTFIQTTKPLN